MPLETENELINDKQETKNNFETENEKYQESEPDVIITEHIQITECQAEKDVQNSKQETKEEMQRLDSKEQSIDIVNDNQVVKNDLLAKKLPHSLIIGGSIATCAVLGLFYYFKYSNRRH